MRIFAATLVLGVLQVLAAPASAHIACDDDFQIVEGHEVSTPYCRDRYLARVARDAGEHVKGREVRNNPGVKDAVCRFVGDDPRVSSDCDTGSNNE